MTSTNSAAIPLSGHRFSLDHGHLLETLAASRHLLIIQDLDGVCMDLVRDPLTRTIDRSYVEAARRLAGHFYVLTNGEHIGSRGLNRIVEQAFETPEHVSEQGFYLPGLAGGGVQLQDRHGTVSHPGVSDAELAYLRGVPAIARRFLHDVLTATPFDIPEDRVGPLVESAVLDNPVSPTLNLNTLYHALRDRPAAYRQLQQTAAALMDRLMHGAAEAGLGDSFFVHYAPNLGRDADGLERVKFSDGGNAGTTDFQFMLKGAIKEVGVLVILNHYYHAQTGRYPLGEHFNARTAPRDAGALLALARAHFDPAQMPRIVGVGDTVTAHAETGADGVRMLRGGSDRGFLTLVQDLGIAFGSDNAVLFIDSSAGEVDRPGLDATHLQACADDPALAPWPGVREISDPDDPLRLNFVFPGGHRQYVRFFGTLAARYPA